MQDRLSDGRDLGLSDLELDLANVDPVQAHGEPHVLARYEHQLARCDHLRGWSSSDELRQRFRLARRRGATACQEREK